MLGGFFFGAYPSWAHWIVAIASAGLTICMLILGVASVSDGSSVRDILVMFGVAALAAAFTALQVHHARQNA